MARRSTKVAAIALANKIARTAWAMMAHGTCYQEPRLRAARDRCGNYPRSRGWKGQRTNNAPSRSIRRSGHPTLASAASRLRALDRDLIRGEHYGLRPSNSAATTGRTDGCTDQLCITLQKNPCQQGAVHRWLIAA
jgi:hypothetical protein